MDHYSKLSHIKDIFTNTSYSNFSSYQSSNYLLNYQMLTIKPTSILFFIFISNQVTVYHNSPLFNKNPQI